MYCILVTGIPAAGKSTMADSLSKRLHIPSISKDTIKERLFDTVGFRSRKEKVQLGIASMEILYYFAEQLMIQNQPFILENNFENVSREGLDALLAKYQYTAITVVLTGDYHVLYQRFAERNQSPQRHRGHVVNDVYPEKEDAERVVPVLSYDDYVKGIRTRGMDRFCANGPSIPVDTTDFSMIDMEGLIRKIALYQEKFQ